MRDFSTFLKKGILAIFLLGLAFNVEANQHNTITTETEVHQEHDQTVHQEHHTDTSPLFFIIISVLIGAFTRFTMQKSALPFTVALLLIGLHWGH